MRFSYILWLSAKNLWRRKLRTFLTAGAVTIGVGSVIFLLSLSIGLRDLIVNQVTNLESLNNVTATTGNSKVVSINDATIAQIKDFGNVQEEEPVANIAGTLRFEKSSTEVVAYAVNQRYFTLNGTLFLIGNGSELSTPHSLFANKTALRLLGLPSDKTALGRPLEYDFKINADLLPPESLPASNNASYTLAGIIDDEGSPIAYLPLSSLTPLGLSSYSGLTVRVRSHDATSVAELRKKIEAIGLKTDYIGDTISQINQVFGTFQAVLAGFGGIALIISVLGMFNTLTVILLEKTREVGFMKAIGIRGRDIILLFLAESVLLSAFGGLLGIAVAELGGHGLNALVNIYAQKAGSPPVHFFLTPLSLYAEVAALTFFLGILVGILPAKRAAKINPLEALRYE